MDKLVVCKCTDCAAEFAMEQEALRDVRELRCPVCDQMFDTPELDEDDDDI